MPKSRLTWTILGIEAFEARNGTDRSDRQPVTLQPPTAVRSFTSPTQPSPHSPTKILCDNDDLEEGHSVVGSGHKIIYIIYTRKYM